MECEIRQGIDYARHDGVTLKGDLYTPKAPGKFPVVIAVHGGGWQMGAPDTYADWGKWLAQRGIAFFAVSYRLSKPGKKSYPDAVHDVRAAVQFVKGESEKLKLDPARVALMGDSAGGHLSALVALAGDAPAFAGAYREDAHAGISTKVKVVVGIYGVYDLVQQWNHDCLTRPRDQIVEKFLGVAPMDDRRVYFEASPMSYVTTDNNTTAFLLSYGIQDDVVDYANQSAALLTALKQARFFARTVVMPGAGHFWMWDPIEEPGSVTGHFAPRLLRFLGERL
jgi:acetyl esterase/lipase